VANRNAVFPPVHQITEFRQTTVSPGRHAKSVPERDTWGAS